jgi:hypothetical protein
MANLKGLFRIMALLAALCATLVGCAVGGTTSSASTTPTASPTATAIPCATHATTTGVVWSQASDKQIHGGISGDAPAVLSAFAYPLAAAAPGYVDSGPAQISLAPDGRHMAVLQAQIIPNSDAPVEYILFSVDTTTHAVTRIANVGTRAALMGWADTKTLLYTLSPFWPSHVTTENLHFYDIATHADSTISGVKGVAKAQVRCSTLYWSEYTHHRASARRCCIATTSRPTRTLARRLTWAKRFACPRSSPGLIRLPVRATGMSRRTTPHWSGSGSTQ